MGGNSHIPKEKYTGNFDGIPKGEGVLEIREGRIVCTGDCWYDSECKNAVIKIDDEDEWIGETAIIVDQRYLFGDIPVNNSNLTIKGKLNCCDMSINVNYYDLKNLMKQHVNYILKYYKAVIGYIPVDDVVDIVIGYLQ